MSFAERRAAVIDEIETACRRHGRDPSEVELLAVSKTRDADVVREAFRHGQVAFGENKVQELVCKADQVEDAVRWHMIGSLQTNKITQVLRVDGLELVHGVDRIKLAQELERRCAADSRELNVLIQLEATGEASKHGVDLADAPALADYLVGDCPHLRLRGFMAIGPREGDPRPVFARVATARAALIERTGLDLPILSLGMSSDLDAAIGAGSTLVRVGTALFGRRIK